MLHSSLLQANCKCRHWKHIFRKGIYTPRIYIFNEYACPFASAAYTPIAGCVFVYVGVFGYENKFFTLTLRLNKCNAIQQKIFFIIFAQWMTPRCREWSIAAIFAPPGVVTWLWDSVTSRIEGSQRRLRWRWSCCCCAADAWQQTKYVRTVITTAGRRSDSLRVV